MSEKIYITREIPSVGIAMLRAKGYEVDINPKDAPLSPKELVRALKKKPYDAVLTQLTDVIDAHVFDAAPHAKIFANYAAGYNNIDLLEAKKRGIAATNTPGVSGFSVAQHAVALILALSTRLVEGNDFVRKGKFTGFAPMHFIGTNLAQKTIGLVGVGNIGSETALIMNKAFKANIVYYDVSPNAYVESSCNARRLNTIEELLRVSDIVSLHVPLLPSTHHIINEKSFDMMKPSAFLINTSRGPVIDEVALVKALATRKIAGAGLDVLEFEPKLTKGLTKLPNVILTPHIASARQDVRDDMARIATQNILDMLETGDTKNRVA